MHQKSKTTIMAVELQQIKKTRAFKNICITIIVEGHWKFLKMLSTGFLLVSSQLLTTGVKELWRGMVCIYDKKH